jgi:hypothetical protein
MLGEHHKRSAVLANTEGLAGRSVLLRPMDCGDRRFGTFRAQGFSSLVFAVFCVGTGLCDVPIIRSYESYRVFASMRAP